MSKNKSRRASGRELELLDRLKHENQSLKKQVAQLRKLIAKFDLDRYHDVKEVLEANERLEAKLEQREAKKQLEKRWECWDCGQGVLRIHILNRRDGVHYWRACPLCNKRTPMKRYSEKVEGVE